MRSGTEERLAESNSLAQELHVGTSLLHFVLLWGKPAVWRLGTEVSITSSVSQYTGTRKVSQDPAIKNGTVPHFISTGTLRMTTL